MLFTTVILSALATLVVATPVPGAGGAPAVSQCNTGPIQCCNDVKSSTVVKKEHSNLLGLLNIKADEVIGNIGMTCSPITAVGVGGNSWLACPLTILYSH
jgi:hypothetical protein